MGFRATVSAFCWMPTLLLEGESVSRKRHRKNVKRIVRLFLVFDKELAPRWSKLSEAVLCSSAFYQRLAHWLIFEYKIPAGTKNAGHPLSCPSIIKYMRTTIHLAATKFNGRASAKTAAIPAARWIHKLKDKIVRLTLKRYRDTGELTDNSASEQPSAPPHLRKAALRPA